MKNYKIFPILLFASLFFAVSCEKEEIIPASEKLTDTLNEDTVGARSSQFIFPHENEPHEGTWLQWPHQYTYGINFRNDLDATWIAMTAALVQSENVHIVAYNNGQKRRIIRLLRAAGVSLAKVDFYIFKTDDVWVRDNGPIFVRNNAGNLRIQDWGFNGWGNKTPYRKCNPIPSKISNALSIPKVNLNSTMKVEGGGYEIDGAGTLMACESSILNSNRNPGMTKAQANAIFRQKLGVNKIIWLKGRKGLDVTDMHIDGFMKFVDDKTIVTMNRRDLRYWQLYNSDINKLYAAKNAGGTPYNFVYLPLTKRNVKTTYGKNLGYKGSYANYYVANTVVLVPNYNDSNDSVANNIIQGLYPGRTVIGVDVRNLYESGGMIHCVTQQQPL